MSDRRHGVGVRLIVRAWGDPKVSCFGVDGVEFAVGSRLHPGDVVADGGDLPVGEGGGWDEHGEVGFPASAGKSGGHVSLFARGRFDAEDQHVLGHPPLLTAEVASNPQGEAFFSQ